MGENLKKNATTNLGMNNKILVKVKHYRSLEIRTQYFFDSLSPFISMNPYRDMIQRLDEKDLF